jgi:hypothetical protein
VAVGEGDARVTAAALAKMLCLASGAFGRPAWDQARCDERAEVILAAAARHSVDPVVMTAIDVIECDLDDRDAPVYEVRRGRRRLVGWDACPMGMRIRGPERRGQLGAADLVELAASDLGRSYALCRAEHRSRSRAEPAGSAGSAGSATRASRERLGPGSPSRSECEWRAVARRNLRSRDYAAQVLAVAGALRGKRLEGGSLRSRPLTERTAEIVRRLLRIFRRNT